MRRHQADVSRRLWPSQSPSWVSGKTRTASLATPAVATPTSPLEKGNNYTVGTSVKSNLASIRYEIVRLTKEAKTNLLAVYTGSLSL